MKYLVFSLITLMFVGCGGSSSSDSDSTAPVISSTKTVLEGAWLKTCNAVDPSDSDTLYDVVENTFSGYKYI